MIAAVTNEVQVSQHPGISPGEMQEEPGLESPHSTQDLQVTQATEPHRASEACQVKWPLGLHQRREEGEESSKTPLYHEQQSEQDPPVRAGAEEVQLKEAKEEERGTTCKAEWYPLQEAHNLKEGRVVLGVKE